MRPDGTDRIAILVSDQALGRLARQLAPTGATSVYVVADLVECIRRSSVRWAVLDPMAVSEGAFRSVLTEAIRGDVRLLMYTPYNSFEHRRATIAAEHLTGEFVFRLGDEIDFPLIAELVARHSESVPARVLAAAQWASIHIPLPLVAALNGMFAWLPIPESVARLAGRAAMTESALRGRLRCAKLATPDTLITIARLARAYDRIGEQGATMEAVALRHGFGSTRSLQRATKRVLGLSPRLAGKALDPRAFSAKLVAGCCRP